MSRVWLLSYGNAVQGNGRAKDLEGGAKDLERVSSGILGKKF